MLHFKDFILTIAQEHHHVSPCQLVSECLFHHNTQLSNIQLLCGNDTAPRFFNL